MDFLRDIITEFNAEIIVGLGVGLILMVLLYLINQIRISSITKKYNRLVEGVNEASLEDMLLQHLDEVKETRNQLSDIKRYCDDIDSRLKLSVQKVGFIRYNAFNDMGSDLSFSIALLDDNLNGFVITSIYGRDDSNVYGKPIINGKSTYPMSVEEIQAVDRAKKYGLSSEPRGKN